MLGYTPRPFIRILVHLDLGETMKKIISVIVVVLIILGLGGLYYHAQTVATKRADALLTQLQTQNSKIIKTISHGAISVGLTGIVDGSYSVKDVKVTLVEFPKYPIAINKLNISNFQEDGIVPTHFKLGVSGAHVVNLSGLLTEAANKVNKKYTAKGKPVKPMPAFATNLINYLQPSADLSLSYDSKDGSLVATSAFSNGAQQILTGKNTYKGFKLTKPISLKLVKTNPLLGSFLDAHLYSGSGKAHYQLKLTADQLLKAAPYMATPLGMLGYSNLDFSLKAHSSLDPKSQQYPLVYRLSLAHGFKMDVDLQMKRLKTLSNRQQFGSILKALTMADKPNPKLIENDDIAFEKVKVVFTDQSLLSRVNKLTTSMFHKDLGVFSAFLGAEKSPYKQWLEPLVQLMKNKGGQITLTVKPPQPFTNSTYNKMTASMNKIAKARDAAVKAHDMDKVKVLQAQYDAANVAMLKKLNMVVTYKAAKGK